MPTYCLECNKRLKDPKSIKLGYGPCCYAKYFAKLKQEEQKEQVLFPESEENVSLPVLQSLSRIG